MRTSSAHHLLIIIASSVYHKCIISASSAHNQRIFSASSWHHILHCLLCLVLLIYHSKSLGDLLAPISSCRPQFLVVHPLKFGEKLKWPPSGKSRIRCIFLLSLILNFDHSDVENYLSGRPPGHYVALQFERTKKGGLQRSEGYKKVKCQVEGKSTTQVDTGWVGGNPRQKIQGKQVFFSLPKPLCLF